MATELWSNFVVHALPVLILCGGALVCLLVDAAGSRHVSELVYGLGLITLVAALVAAWSQWSHFVLMGDSPVVLGFIKMDSLTLSVILLALVVGVITLLSALGYVRLHQDLAGEFCVLVLFALVGMIIWVASDHLLINFIGLETMSLAIYVLVGAQKKSAASAEAAAKYFIMGGVASAILLFGIALFYGGYNTFSISVISVKTTTLAGLRDAGLAMILSGMFFKLAVVPFHFWAPDVYEGAPAPVTGFMATGVKLAAFGFTIRLFSEFHLFDEVMVQKILGALAVMSLVVANVTALFQENLKRMLAYSSIAHAGFMLLGLIAGIQDGHYNPATAQVLVFYLLSYSFMTLGAFAVLSLLIREKGEACRISDLRGLGRRHPVLALVLTIFLLSLTGIPPTAGFAAKYGVLRLAVLNGHAGLAILAVVTSVISAFYYLRPIMTMYFRDVAERDIITEIPATVLTSLALCLVGVLVLGLMPDAFLEFSAQAVGVVQP